MKNIGDMKSFSKQFQNSYSKRQKEVNLISNLLDSSSDFIVYGISGSGKTTMMRDILKEKSIHYIKINCIQCQTKKTLIQTVLYSLEKKFQWKLKQTTKSSHFIHRLHQLYEFTKEYNVPVDNNLSFSFENDQFYLFLDNIEKLSISHKFFAQLINIKNILKINFSVIFCGVSFRDEVSLENVDLELLPSILITPMQEDLHSVIMQHLKAKLSNEDQACFKAFGDKLTKDIISHFPLLVKSATTLCSIALRLFKVLIFRQSKDSPSTTNFPALIKNDTYVLARKLILNDPYLNDGDPKEFIEKITNTNLQTEQTSNLKQTYQIQKYFYLDKNQVQNQKVQKQICKLIFQFDKLNSISQMIKLPFFSSMILVACWIGNRNPEGTDKRLFTDYGTKTYKGKNDASLKSLKAIKVDRLISLTQSIISQSDYLKEARQNWGKEAIVELNCFDQRIDFYSQIASLIEMKFLIIESNEKSISKAQYLSNLDEQSMQAVAAQYKIALFDNLYKRD